MYLIIICRKKNKKIAKGKKAQFFLIQLAVVLLLVIGVIVGLMLYEKKAISDFQPVIDFVSAYWYYIVAIIFILLFKDQVIAIVNTILGKFGVRV